MSILTGTPMREVAAPAVQGSTAAQLSALQHHQQELQLRADHIPVEIEQLREQQTHPFTRADGAQFNGPLADAQHRHMATMLDYDATHAKIKALEKTDQGAATPTLHRPSATFLDRNQSDKAG